jgi:geranylgeranyl diphosphate synthase type II
MDRHRALIDARIQQWCAEVPKDGLHEPMVYLMGLPAKRVRPALVLLGCEVFGGSAESALDEAVGIELFHNFTLMHDDIMDEAPLRRGRPTVHAKWNVNRAILSGDAMLVRAYQLMARNTEVLSIFSRYALEVCQGQQHDMDFERRVMVSVAEYTDMIRLKTAVLLSCALQVGACIAGAHKADREHLGAFGEHLGIAFQLRDDLLDSYGDPARTGKQLGGDLRAGKKTYLLIRGLERSAEAGRTELRDELAKPAAQRDVSRMMSTIEELGVRREAEAEVRRHDSLSIEALNGVRADEARKRPLRELALGLLDRVH